MVVFFDIDGTVVDNETQIIPESTVEAIRLLRKNGHIPVVNTGRPYGQIDPRVRVMDFEGWVGACGMEVILDGKFIHKDYPTQELCDLIIRGCRENRMLIQAESEKELFYDGDLVYTPAPLREADRLAKKGIHVLPYQQVERCRFIKFVTHENEESNRAGFLELMKPYYDPIYHRGNMIEYIKKGNTKADGMRRILEALNIPREQTFAIGDSENDLPMFAMAGTTICMGDGMESLKPHADYVTDAVLDDGIYNALKHFGLI